MVQGSAIAAGVETAVVQTPRTMTTPDGHRVQLVPRGVRWSPITVNGCPVLCAPDRNGDVGVRWRAVPVDSTPEDVERIKAMLRGMLDAADPPGVRAVR